jgi:hypothetical protein
MREAQYEHGYRCRRCGTGTAFGVLITEDGQVKLWCLSCLQEGLSAAPHAAPPPLPRQEPGARSQEREEARRP